jgi:hypothetical protein
MRLIVTLNRGALDLSNKHEPLKLKLLNQDLTERLLKLEESHYQSKAEEILKVYQPQDDQLPFEVSQCLETLESSMYLVSRERFKMGQIESIFYSNRDEYSIERDI